MRINNILVGIILFFATSSSAIAYTYYNSAYPTLSAYNQGSTVNYGKYATQYGYGQGYTYASSRVISGYSPVDGYRLTDYGPYPYPRTAQFVSDPQFRGHYSVWDGTYRNGYTGRLVNQYPRQSGGVPAYYYPSSPYTVNRAIYY